MRPLRILLWHVHGSYTTAFVQGRHTYLLPTLPARGAFGLGRAQTWTWPPTAIEVSPSELGSTDVDVAVLQRPDEFALAEAWLGGRRVGVDVPAIYLEHNAPQGRINEMSHPAADRDDVLLVHVTHFNALFWDAGATRTTVVEHGVVDPGYRGPGALERAATLVNEPVRRARVTGADLLPRLSARSGVPIDVFGMQTASIGGTDLPQAAVHTEIAARRVYLHTARWTSLGLSLIEAMHLGLPVVALATTGVADAVPSGAGVVSNDINVLARGLRALVRDPEEATVCGKVGREAAVARFGLQRFLADWDRVLEEACA
jgi:glycosyltransferase involved in cell wall biosynthesis